MKKSMFAIAVIVVMLIFSGWYYSSHQQPNTDLVLYGNVDVRQVSLAFDGQGRVAYVYAEEGDQVQVGQVLAVLDTNLLALQVDQANAQVAVQQQLLLKLQNGALPQEIDQARNRLAAAQADATRAKQDFQRLQDITTTTQGRGVSRQELDRTQSYANMTQAKVLELQAALHLVEIGPRDEDISAAQAQLQAAEAHLALLQYQLDQGELKSPVDAIVRSRLVEPGAMVTAQRPVFALALTQPKWVRVYVSEPSLGLVQSGMKVQVMTDSHPNQPIIGKVGYISSVAEFTPKTVQSEELRTSLVYEVRVLVDDPENRLRLGQPATVNILADQL